MSTRRNALALVASFAAWMLSSPVAAFAASAEATAPSLVLQRYAEALAQLSRPQYFIFNVAIEQSGLNNLEQTHHIYRTPTQERDELLSDEGTKLKSPVVRIAAAPYRYDVLLLAPRPGDYSFTYTGVHQLSGRTAYVFRTDSTVAAAYAATSVWIDVNRYLPVAIDFHTAAGAVKGAGRITFSPQQSYWLAREVTVSAEGAGKTARQRIVWSAYSFPATLPRSTFAPRPVETPPA